MPAPVHAVLVTRSSPAAASRFERALRAVRGQSAPIAGITVVVCGDPAPLRQAVDASGAEAAVTAPERTPFAGAVEAALDRIPDGHHAWLLDDDCAPEPDALARIVAALERQPSVAIAAPKLVRSGDHRRIESFGVTMTRWGRTVDLARGEYDQGQHDHADDVLGSDIRGALLRADAVGQLVPDRALLGMDEGLDLGVRARLGGRRVALAPHARVAVLPPRQAAFARAVAVRVAHLHRRLAYAPIIAVPFQWLLLLPFALWATAVALLAKRPGRVAPEWVAAAIVMVRVVSIARSRGRIRRARTGSWTQVDPLRITRAELREHLQATDDTRDVRRAPLRFFSGGGAWAVLAVLVASVAAFIALLTWPAIGGGALLPLRSTVAGLWSDAMYGLRPEGVADIGAADPFSAVLALLGTLWPWVPSYALVLLWLLAAPLAALGGWFAATRVTEASRARIVLALLWAAAPPLWDGLMAGRPAAVIAHLLLPWLVFAGAAAHRSWTTSGAASLVGVGVLACAPSLAPALIAIWIVAIVLVAVRPRRGVARVVWLIVPSAAMFAPLVWEHAARGTLWAAFADPGAVAPFAHGSAGSVAAGLVDASAWTRLLADLGVTFDAAAWAPLLFIPAALLALGAAASRQFTAALIALAAAAAGSVTAVVALNASFAAVHGQPVAVWPGSALSLAWLGLAVGTAITIGRIRVARGAAAFLAVACVVLAVAPQVTALHRGATPLHEGDTSTLPAYIAAEARGDRAIGTLIVTPLADGSVETDVVWGASETLGGTSTLAATVTDAGPDDEQVAEIVGGVISGSTESLTRPLADAGITFVLLRHIGNEPNSAQRVLGLTAQATMDQRPGFVRVGETARGVLWRVDAKAAERDALSGSEATTAGLVTGGQAALVAAALLLAIPTRRTRDEARLVPRVVGAPGEAS